MFWFCISIIIFILIISKNLYCYYQIIIIIFIYQKFVNNVKSHINLIFGKELYWILYAKIQPNVMNLKATIEEGKQAFP